jgi:hypothetical protein
MILGFSKIKDGKLDYCHTCVEIYQIDDTSDWICRECEAVWHRSDEEKRKK